MSQINKKFTTDLYEVSYTITLIDDGKRLDQFLKNHFQTFSREQIKKKIKNQDITISGRNHKLKPSSNVKEGETVYIKTKKEDFAPEMWNGKEIELEKEIEIIEQNDDYIVINKPPFMATHPTGKHLFYCATVYLENLLKMKISSVHRLDRETSGVLILSKNSKNSQKLTQLFEDRKTQKYYLLISSPEKEVSNIISANQRLGTKENFKPELFTHCFDEKSKEGKSAETTFYKVYQNKEVLISIAKPITGRQHQIRAHASFHGFSLLGDKLYNGDPKTFMRFKDKIATEDDFKRMILPRHALHALSLHIPGDINKYFTSKIPKDFSILLKEKFKINNAEKLIINKLEEIQKERL